MKIQLIAKAFRFLQKSSLAKIDGSARVERQIISVLSASEEAPNAKESI
jgi:hypothetical protein